MKTARYLLVGLVVGLLLGPAGSFAYTAVSDWLDTGIFQAHGGLDVQTYHINASNIGLGAFPKSAPLPINPSGNVPFALTVLGDTWLGDVYCLADVHVNASLAPNSSGCVYGRALPLSAGGGRVGPIIMQSGFVINSDDGNGGPGYVMWADRPNIDGAGNRGYMDIWAWGQNDSAFSNTLNFGNRDNAGSPHRRFRILNDGSVNLPDLAGSGTSRLCINAAGTLVRGGC